MNFASTSTRTITTTISIHSPVGSGKNKGEKVPFHVLKSLSVSLSLSIIDTAVIAFLFPPLHLFFSPPVWISCHGEWEERRRIEEKAA